MQHTSERNDAPRRGLARRVLESFTGRGRGPGADHRSWKPARTLPMLAVGTVALVGVSQWGPEPVQRTVTAEVAVQPVEVAVELPMEVNARVEKWMRRFTTDQRRTFEVFLARESIFSEMIQGKLRERGMPEDLLYLAMIESGFSTRATSHVGAGGVWQFMGPTAKEYGLRVDRWVDERRDPVKATDAALDYLQWLHGRYDSWYLAAAAYNAGPGRVDGILRRHAEGRKGDEAIYWEIIDHLPRETRDYVPKLLAAVTLARETERYGFRVDPLGAYEYDRVWVPGGTPLSAIAASLDVPVSSMKDLNPHLVRGSTPPGASYALRVPVGRSHQVIASMGGGRLTRIADDD